MTKKTVTMKLGRDGSITMKSTGGVDLRKYAAQLTSQPAADDAPAPVEHVTSTFDGAIDTDTPLQAAAREAGWALTTLIDTSDWQKREQMSDIIGRLAVALIDGDTAPEVTEEVWLNIATAPKGTEILVWNGRRRHVASFDAVECEWVSSFKTVTKRFVVSPRPTHWIPLPGEPAAIGGVRR